MKFRLISAMAFLMLLSWTRNTVVLNGQEEGWASVGPEGGTTYALAIDPHDHSVVYAGTNGGVFKSIDSGAHWSPVNAGLPMPLSAYDNGGPYIRSLAIDPQNTATVYAGVSFFGDVLFAEPRGVGVYRTDDGGESWHAANAGIENRIPWALAIDPVTPTTLYTIGQIGPNGNSDVFKSTDGGASWSRSIPLFAFDLTIDPHAPETVYAGPFKTTDGGTTWTQMNVGGTGTIVTELAIDPADSSIVYAGTRGGGVFKSTNAGNSWTPVNTGLTGLFVRTLKIDPRSPGTLYAGLEDGAVFKTTNQGATWTPINSGLPPSRIGQSGPAWGIDSLAVDPETPTIVYAATQHNGVFKTVNGGDQWSRTTLSSIRVFSIAVDSTASKVYVGEDGARVYTRSDKGEWTFADLNPTPLPIPSIRVSVVALDALVPTTAYATAGGLLKTTDGGATWSPVLGGPVFTVALDPIVPSTLYAGGNGARKSLDGGATWTEINQGLGGGPLQLLAVDPQAPTTLYAGFGGFAVLFGNGALYKSVDGGSNWALAMDGLPSAGALAIDPQVTSTIYAGDRGSRVFKSINGGESWSLSSTGLPTYNVVALAVHPEAPSIVFAGTYGGGVFRSTDGGASWSPMNDQPPNLLVRALAIDARSSTLYAGTDGGGVFTIGVPAQFPLTVTKTGHGVGTVVSSPQGIDCGSDCTEQFAQFAAGATVTLTATPAAGIVTGWTGCDSDTGRGRTSTCTVTIGAARTVTVNMVGPPIEPPGRDKHSQRDVTKSNTDSAGRVLRTRRK
jgi:photosystem II stability/assembly factor-like uncharacterized protein